MKINENLKQKTYKALLWSFIDSGGEQLLHFLFSVILARLLFPEQFGLIGIAYIVTEFARIFVQSGFGMALINAKNITKTDECSVFYFNIIIGAIATFSIILFAEQIGSYFKSKELIPVIKILAFNVFVGSFSAIQTVLFVKNINFKKQTKVSLPSTLISGIVGIILAFCGFGVWSLVAQSLLKTLLISILMWLFHSWRPSLLFSFKSLSKMFKYGSRLLIGSILSVLFNNIYALLIGKLFTPAQLGFYTRAKNMQQLPLGTLWAIIGRVAFPVFSSIKDNSSKLKFALRKSSCSIAFIVLPTLVLGTITAPNLFYILFGPTWMPSFPMFQILCLASILQPFDQLYANVILSKGKSSLQLILQVIKQFSIIISILLSFSFGIFGILKAFLVVSYLNFFLTSIMIRKELNYTFKEQLFDLLPYMACTAIAGIVTFGISYFPIHNNHMSFALQVTGGISIYILFGFIFKLATIVENKKIIFPFLKDKYERIVVTNTNIY